MYSFVSAALDYFWRVLKNARDFENLWVWKIEQGLLGSYSFHYLDSLEEYSHSTRLHAYRILGYCFIDIVCEFFACFIWVTIFYIWDPLPVPRFGSVGYQRRVRVWTVIWSYRIIWKKVVWSWGILSEAWSLCLVKVHGCGYWIFASFYCIRR